MKFDARLTKIEHRRKSGRLLMGYENGPLWCNGRIIPDNEVTTTDVILRIVYQAPAEAQNVRKLRWGDDDT